MFSLAKQWMSNCNCSSPFSLLGSAFLYQEYGATGGWHTLALKLPIGRQTHDQAKANHVSAVSAWFCGGTWHFTACIIRLCRMFTTTGTGEVAMGWWDTPTRTDRIADWIDGPGRWQRSQATACHCAWRELQLPGSSYFTAKRAKASETLTWTTDEPGKSTATIKGNKCRELVTKGEQQQLYRNLHMLSGAPITANGTSHWLASWSNGILTTKTVPTGWRVRSDRESRHNKEQKGL